MNAQDQKNRIQAEDVAATAPLAALQEELSSGLRLYWTKAAAVLRGSGIRLLGPAGNYFRPEKNFFSLLFLYSYHRAGIAAPRRIIYAAVNQCLRGMVTGCDNILDDEYKTTLETDLPAGGTRFRSVLDIMVSDRVLFEILLDGFRQSVYDLRAVLAAECASLQALTRSGAQEASEEAGIADILPPEQILQSIHHHKTGLLFQCPWAVPLILEKLDEETVSSLLKALYHIGMGCQILDDMVDLARDILKSRHNYAASVIYHDSCGSEGRRLKTLLASNPEAAERKDLLLELPHAASATAAAARAFLMKGLGTLFGPGGRHLIEPSVAMLSEIIGADPIMSATARCN